MAKRSSWRFLAVLGLGLLTACGGGGSAGDDGPGTVLDLACAYASEPPRIELRWRNPADPQLAGVLIARSVGAPVAGRPVDDTVHAVGSTLPGGGDVVFQGSASSFDDVRPPSGVLHYVVFPYDHDHTYGPGATDTARVRQLVVYQTVSLDFGWGDIYLVDLEVPGETQVLNAPRGQLQPVFLEDATTDHVYFTRTVESFNQEIVRVAYDQPGIETILTPPTPAGSRNSIWSIDLSPRATHLAFTATTTLSGGRNLYLVDLSRLGEASRLNGDLVEYGAVDHFRFSPDGSRLLYCAEEETRYVSELYVLPIPPILPAEKLSGASSGAGDVRYAEFSVDGHWIYYWSDEAVEDLYELWRVTPDAPGAPVPVSGPLPDGATIGTYGMSPDGRWVAYETRPAHDNAKAIHLVETTSPGAASLSIEVPAHEPTYIEWFDFTPDAASLVYQTYGSDPESNALYMVGLDGSKPAQQLTPTLAADKKIGSWVLDPTGRWLAYEEYSKADEPSELFLVDLDRPGIATRVSGPMAEGGKGLFEGWAEFTKDGRFLIYAAEEDTAGVLELYAVPMSDPILGFKLSGPLPEDHEVYVSWCVP